MGDCRLFSRVLSVIKYAIPTSQGKLGVDSFDGGGGDIHDSEVDNTVPTLSSTDWSSFSTLLDWTLEEEGSVRQKKLIVMRMQH